MKYKENFIIVHSFIVLSLLLLFGSGCFPDRLPTDPDYQVQDVRRPGLEHHLPLSDAIDVERDIPITIWFDEMMDNTSIQNSFFVWPSVKLDSVQAVAIDPDNADIIYAAKPGDAVFNSTDAADSWQWLTVGNLKVNATDLVTVPGISGVLYLASSDNGVYKSSDNGLTWQQINTGLPEMNIQKIAVDPVNQNIVYAITSSSGLYQSENAGQTWVERNNGMRISRPPKNIDINPIDSKILYVPSEGDFIFKSTTGGESWTRLQSGLLSRNFKEIKIHPQDTSLVYAVSNGGGIYRTKSGGSSWALVIEGLSSLNIQTIAVHPSDTARVMIAISSAIYSSVNMGDTWTLAGTFAPDDVVTKLAIHPSSPERVYASTNLGIYRSDDFGKSWEFKNDLSLDDLYLSGSYQFETWQDSTVVVGILDSVTIDTTVIFPYVYDRALTAWIANGKTGPAPVDPNPSATKLIFMPDDLMIRGIKYQVKVRGIFESDKTTLKSSPGASDIQGNSKETDSNFTFTTKNK